MLVVALIAGITTWSVAAGEDGERACPTRISPGVERVVIGAEVPEFSLPDLDGRCVRSAAYRGQPLIVNFWASWCHPCRAEFPLFEDARDRYAERGIEVLGIAHKDIAGDARSFAEARGADWPLLLDDNDAVSKLFGVTSIPQTFFIARNGTLVSHVYGLTSARDLNAEIKRILQR